LCRGMAGASWLMRCGNLGMGRRTHANFARPFHHESTTAGRPRWMSSVPTRELPANPPLAGNFVGATARLLAGCGVRFELPATPPHDVGRRHLSAGWVALRASFTHTHRLTPPAISEAVGHASSVPFESGTLEASPTGSERGRIRCIARTFYTHPLGERPCGLMQESKRARRRPLDRCCYR
jgi:hypothetical protein